MRTDPLRECWPEFILILFHEAAEGIAAQARKGCEYVAGLLTAVCISPVCTDTRGYKETTERSETFPATVCDNTPQHDNTTSYWS